jgi:hypothetical protein
MRGAWAAHRRGLVALGLTLVLASLCENILWAMGSTLKRGFDLNLSLIVLIASAYGLAETLLDLPVLLGLGALGYLALWALTQRAALAPLGAFALRFWHLTETSATPQQHALMGLFPAGALALGLTRAAAPKS